MRFLPLVILCLSHAGWAQQADALQKASHPRADIVGVIGLVSDSAIAYRVKALEAFGTRYASFSNRHEIAEWVRSSFVAAGVQNTLIDSFEYEGVWQKNVIAAIPGSIPDAGEILIGAHYDSYSIIRELAPGADDNASGTAGIMEIARVLLLSDYRPRATIRFLAFGAEELGLVGSSVYAEKVLNQGTRVLLMQNYDMIAYRDTTEPDRIVNIDKYEAAEDIAILDSVLMTTYTNLQPVTSTRYIRNSDSWPFALRGIRSVFVIEDANDFNPRLHTPRDSSIFLDFSYAAEIVRSAIALTMTIDETETHVQEEEHRVPTRFELHQNVPNPFNPSTQILYTIGERSLVSIEILDILGRTVEILVEGERERGTFGKTWTPRGAAGVYFCRMTAVPLVSEGRAERTVRRMVYLR